MTTDKATPPTAPAGGFLAQAVKALAISRWEAEEAERKALAKGRQELVNLFALTTSGPEWAKVWQELGFTYKGPGWEPLDLWEVAPGYLYFRHDFYLGGWDWLGQPLPEGDSEGGYRLLFEVRLDLPDGDPMSEAPDHIPFGKGKGLYTFWLGYGDYDSVERAFALPKDGASWYERPPVKDLRGDSLSALLSALAQVMAPIRSITQHSWGPQGHPLDKLTQPQEA